jgi:hypothetical protein
MWFYHATQPLTLVALIVHLVGLFDSALWVLPMIINFLKYLVLIAFFTNLDCPGQEFCASGQLDCH